MKADSIKVTTINTSKESRTAKLEYQDGLISYITQNNTYECKMVTTFNGSLPPNTPATVNFHHCTKDGGPAPGLRIISDNPDHYFEVKEKFEQ